MAAWSTASSARHERARSMSAISGRATATAKGWSSIAWVEAILLLPAGIGVVDDLPLPVREPHECCATLIDPHSRWLVVSEERHRELPGVMRQDELWHSEIGHSA